jgi:hypothetical protein
MVFVFWRITRDSFKILFFEKNVVFYGIYSKKWTVDSQNLSLSEIFLCSYNQDSSGAKMIKIRLEMTSQ